MIRFYSHLTGTESTWYGCRARWNPNNEFHITVYEIAHTVSFKASWYWEIWCLQPITVQLDPYQSIISYFLRTYRTSSVSLSTLPRSGMAFRRLISDLHTFIEKQHAVSLLCHSSRQCCHIILMLENLKALDSTESWFVHPHPGKLMLYPGTKNAGTCNH
jgi:hypothetical protein